MNTTSEGVEKRYSGSLYIDVDQSCWPGPPPPGMRQQIIQNQPITSFREKLRRALTKGEFQCSPENLI